MDIRPAITRSLISSALLELPAALDPYQRTRRAIARLDLPDHVAVVALGKAARSMAAAAADVLGHRLTSGVLIAPDSAPLDRFDVRVGSHPLPDERSVQAARAAVALAGRTDHDLLIALVSGGGSAMAEIPRRPLDIAVVADITQRLMLAGASIDELNLVRRHLSDFKNGGLSARSKVPVVTLVISDVVDGPPSMVSSGPTLHDGSEPLHALAVLERRLGRPVPQSVHTALATAASRRRNEDVVVVADRHTAYAELSHRLAAAGLPASSPVRLEGDAAVMARTMLHTPGLVIGTGETTVTVSGDGVGGRNQHGALAAAIELDGTEGVFGALGTDGVDGPTDAAGAVVDGTSAQAMRSAGIDPADALDACDSHTALDRIDALVRTGPTGTNVADVWVSYRVAVR
ncbi:MAG: glycerate kinase [Acidimicrobiia bacterium]